MKRLLLLLALASLAGCTTLRTRQADRTWEHLGLPENGADTTVKRDADGNPNFGPR